MGAILKRGKMSYRVNFWGSHPEAENDDLWYGNDFASLKEAEAAYCADVVGITNCPPQDVAFIELDGPGVNKYRANPMYKLKQRNYDDWKREYAMQLGMGLGVDAYNDAWD